MSLLETTPVATLQDIEQNKVHLEEIESVTLNADVTDLKYTNVSYFGAVLSGKIDKKAFSIHANFESFIYKECLNDTEYNIDDLSLLFHIYLGDLL